jgi:hypothetical protein
VPPVVTAAATVLCSHGGRSALSAGQLKLTVASTPVLRADEVAGKPVVACPNQPTPATPGLLPCLVLTAPSSGGTSVLTVDASPVLLANASGTTASSPAGTWGVTAAGQGVLNAS